MYFNFLRNFCLKHFSLQEELSEMLKMVFMYSTRYTCQVSVKFEFSRQIFENFLNVNLHKKSVQRTPSCSMRTNGRTDRYDDANSLF